ncbi:MAG: hypothetical protein J7K89_07730 [Candidatus Cloacimonetes bacterium]|nr:hypothetical protein [Candidatus Cloacimonadota bacterium]
MAAKTLDRRWIFLFLFIGVALPLIFVIGLPIETTENVRAVYQMVEDTPAGSTVLISFDYDPASKPELHPMGRALLQHCFEKDLKVIITALWPMGVMMANDILDDLQPSYPNKVYGQDYVNMGFKAGGMVTIQAMGKHFKGIYTTDSNGTPVENIPMMKHIDNFENIAFVISLSAGAPGVKEWVQVAGDTYGRQVSSGVTGVSVSSVMPYVNEQKQLTGLLAGLKGAAEYEYLIGHPGTATSGMDAQSLAHLIIIIFIIIGNITYWRNKKKQKKEV